MIRFYCTICKKIKRAQKYPANVTNTESITVMDRVGACRFHSFPRTQSIMGRNVGHKAVK